MNRLGTAIVLFLLLTLFACGGGPGANVIQGPWNAVLTNPDETEALAFTATLTQSGKTVNVTQFTLTRPTKCFAEGTTASGLFTHPYTTHGVTSGDFQMTVQSDPANADAPNRVVLTGQFQRNVIWGTWTLTSGSLCNLPENAPSGDFIMSQM